jgi:hypothetical protein
MKIDSVYFMIAVAIGMLLSYGLWTMAGEMSTFIAIGSVVYLCITLGMAMGVRHDNPRTRVNLSMVSVTFFALGFAINVVFCFVGNAPVTYMLATAISFLIYLAVANFIQNAKQ